jgi:ABC-type proline/glycine betaine transport system permease subunit
VDLQSQDRTLTRTVSLHIRLVVCAWVVSVLLAVSLANQ